MRVLRIAAVLLLGVAPLPASAADYTMDAAAGDVVCASDNALARIERIFAYTERTLWHRGFVMESIGNPRLSGHPYTEPGLVQRDYCVADSVMTDGSEHRVYYAIEHGLGFVGIGDEVDFCIPALDPWRIHDGDCRTVR